MFSQEDVGGLTCLGTGSRGSHACMLSCFSRVCIVWTKVHIVKAVVFPVVRHGCESWTVKKAECQRNDAFELYYISGVCSSSPLDSKEIKPINLKGN